MQLLLDTHALLWWFSGDEALSAEARNAIADGSNSIYVSAASVWEIATKNRLGKLSIGNKLMADLDGSIASQGFTG
ncbi:MAG: type II toxin-antitoxin system VapC family toxin, partial [Hyphomicrobiales bacterium]|nr:type II toxin-antitoxin system VapC family toxin [Hyphomicrobiales bacterium]